MKLSTVRLLIFMSLLVTAGIVITQVYWVAHMHVLQPDAVVPVRMTEVHGWVITSAALIATLILLVLSLCTLMKQKFLGELQKDFVDNITHEFKTPLSTIQISAEVLSDPKIVSSPQRLQNYAAIISKESEHLTTHVEKVFQLAEIEKGDLRLHREKICIPQLLSESVKIFEKIIKERDAEVKIHSVDNQLNFDGDYFHLKNILINLIDNAIKYCDNTPVIHIFLKIRKREFDISVEDNGIGIDKQHIKRLFRKFYRVPTGNVHNVKGVGLGLNYVRFIARAHGGDVHCSSCPGKGSTFTLKFPLKSM
jgi:two-component system, OmpR family, phosphate regulon sensor histidine kinase PhoR